MCHQQYWRKKDTGQCFRFAKSKEVQIEISMFSHNIIESEDEISFFFKYPRNQNFNNPVDPL